MTRSLSLSVMGSGRGRVKATGVLPVGRLSGAWQPEGVAAEAGALAAGLEDVRGHWQAQRLGLVGALSSKTT